MGVSAYIERLRDIGFEMRDFYQTNPGTPEIIAEKADTTLDLADDLDDLRFYGEIE